MTRPNGKIGASDPSGPNREHADSAPREGYPASAGGLSPDQTDTTSGGLLQRFPSLGLLRSGRGVRRIPFVQTLASTDCGAACLAMVLGYHGKSIPLEDVRDATGTNRDGVDALAIVHAGQTYGLRGRGVRVEPEELPFLEPASILHWEFNHFIILERVGRRAVHVIDPVYGRRRVPMDEFRKNFTGVAITFEPSEEFEPSREATGGVWRYFRRVLGQRAVLAQVLVTSLIVQGLLLATPIVTSALVDRVVPRDDYQLMLVLILGVAGVTLFHFVSTLVRAHLLLHLRTHMDMQMTLGFLEHLVSLPFGFFQSRSAGDLILRLNSNATMRELLTSAAMSALLDGCLVSLYAILLFAINPGMGLIVLLLAALKIGVFLLSRGVYRALMARDLAAQARSEGYVVEILSGIETLKSLGAEQKAVEHWSNLFVDQVNVSLQRGRVSALVDSVMSALQVVSPLAILLYGVTEVMAGRLSLGSMLGLAALGAGLLTPLSTLIGNALSLQLLRSYVERLDDVLQHAPERRAAGIAAPPLRGAVTLERVWFAYGSHAPPVLRDLSLHIRPGAHVAIVGRSGAGKSTLARLLLALHSPTQGRILYDGVDLSSLDVRSVRKQMGIVPQEPYLFAGSIRENILLGRPALGLEAAVEAARLANIHDEILSMPMGYDTLLGDAGATISAGQRQRIALARAMVHRPAILLLDEATSALDAVNERQVQANLAHMSCTRIVIAHRLSTVVNADLIIVLADGVLAESGTHAGLLASKGVYAALIAAQLHGGQG